ncbi:MAG TPA: histidine phosphatase family protein [Syntrophales bacterium]|nr:histidine phosphatase family protein [Syntrophales bacterium]HOM08001.1 histidine phosphatase family protein [Syntrophales bacterium]HOO00627.1 histidine phosphatase family protein [Syntrophales bacterium]HPC01881.1 histidine phosphatase family protein [Syntrophales bacterium]HPQ05833.1 histidine phosphatase family protein [Syntrophales bacterium]
MGTLIMVRHGQASFGSDNYDRLSERGVLQSRLLAAYLLKTGRKPDLVCSGEMERQRHTAREIVAAYRGAGVGLPDPEVLPAFNEYNSRALVMAALKAQGYPSGKGGLQALFADPAAFQDLFARTVQAWINGEVTVPGAVSWGEFRQRVEGGLGALTAGGFKGRTVVCVTSGGPISVAFQRATGLADRDTVRVVWQIVNTSLTTFLFAAERFSLVSFNNYAHLELEGDPSLITYR